MKSVKKLANFYASHTNFVQTTVESPATSLTYKPFKDC
jgi:hypothetical protein